MALNRGYAYRLEVAPAEAGRAVVALLAARFKHSSLDTWCRRAGDGEITVDGATASPTTVVRAGAVVVWQRPPWDEPDVPRQVDVIHDDADLVVVAKPSGLPTMPAGGFLEHTLLAVVRARYGDVHPVHRLGRGTSGLVVFARTASAASALGAAWRTRDVTKIYRTLVAGAPPWAAHEIATPIGRVPHALLGQVYGASATGRPAHSRVRVRARRDDGTVCEVAITTGRPHQIRIHLAAAGHPLVGDPLYPPGGVPAYDTPARPGDLGYLLHAHQVAFAHPRGGARQTFVAPLPLRLRTPDDER